MMPRASIRSVVLASGLALAGGCQKPRVCEETYPPIVNLLVGLPIPMLLTLAFAAMLMLGIGGALDRERRLPKGGLATVAAACAWAGICTSIKWRAGFFVWPVSLAVLVFLNVREQGPDPNQQSWMHRLSGAGPSLGNRLHAGFLLIFLLLVTYVGSVLSIVGVGLAGERCREPVSSVTQ
jgi:hypothetical protein